jgi:hypothetical protein
MLNINNPSRMKSQKLTKILAAVLLIATVTGCKQKTGTFKLTGKLQGITEGKIILSGTKENEFSDTAIIKNGEFVFTGDIPEPAEYKLEIPGKEFPTYFYAENAEITLTGNADTLYNAVVAGGSINEDEKKYNAGLIVLSKKNREKYKLDSLRKEFLVTKNENLKKIIDTCSKKMLADYNQYQSDFIKQNPASYYSAILIERMSNGMSAKEIEQNLKLLDPKIYDFSVVENIRTMIENLKTTDIKVDAFTSNATDSDFAVDKSFAGKDFKDMVYLASFQNDNICALRKDGVISMIDPKGGKISEFKSKLKATPTAIAIDQSNGNIYVLGTIIETKEKKIRGKMYKIDEPLGVECLVYDNKGTELRSLKLDDLKTATGAKVINKKLLVADFKSRKVEICNLETGKMETSINDLRTCCRILDFGVNSRNEILVANLGAFRVQAFDYSGKIKYAFGKRGQAINDFHGCCNPVNVTSLSSGAIVTVEKDPTRIKIYSKSGARQIAGIQELVKGCRYIPMTSDSKNNIYLASVNSGIVKCGPAQTKQ